MKKLFLFLIILITLPVLLNAWADWNSISTRHFRIYYKNNWRNEAESALRTLEYYRPQLESLTGNTCGRIPIKIEDIGNLVNGYTDPVGTRIALFAYPPTSDELAVGEDWWQMVACHEYIHELQMTKATGTPELIRLLFGNIFYPHLWQPGWMTEGITVYGESQLTPYAGRLNGGTYPSIITSLAKKGKLPSPTKASYFSYDTPQATYYTFGGSFYDYLTKTYGKNKLAQLFEQTSSSTWSYSSLLLPNLYLDKAYFTTFGKNTAELWADWQKYEATLTYQYPTHNLTEGGWFKSDLQYQNGRLYYIDYTAVKTGPYSTFTNYKICSIDLKQTQGNALAKPDIEVVQNGDFPAGYRIIGNDLYYTRSEWRRGFSNSEMDGFGSVAQLWHKDLRTGKGRKLYEGQFRVFCPLGDGTILLAVDNLTHTRSTLVKLNPLTGSAARIYQAEGLVSAIFESDNALVIGLKKPWHNNAVYRLEPENGRLTPLVETTYYTVPVSLSKDVLLFNSVFDGNFGAYTLNLRSRQCYKISGFSDIRTPVLMDNNQACFISLNEKGYDVYRESVQQIPFQIPSGTDPAWNLASQVAYKNAGSPVVQETKTGAFLYNLGHMLVPRVLHIPIITTEIDTLSVDSGQAGDYKLGVLLYGNDAVGEFPAWTAQVVYDTADSLQFPHNLSYTVALQNNFFHPLKHTVSYTYEYGNTEQFSSQQSMTLLQRQNYGLNNVETGFMYTFDKHKNRKIWYPFLQAGIQWSGGNLITRHFIPLETKKFLPSDRERKGWQSITQYHQKLPLKSEFKGMAVVARDPDADMDEIFGRIRGYDKDFNANQGAMLQASIYKPVLKIRQGLWSPQIYMEDINLGLFYDTTLSRTKGQDDQHAYGVELLGEFGLAYNLRLNLGARYGYNEEKKAGGVEIIMGSLF